MAFLEMKCTPLVVRNNSVHEVKADANFFTQQVNWVNCQDCE